MKTRSPCLTWASVGTGTWQQDGRTDRIMIACMCLALRAVVHKNMDMLLEVWAVRVLVELLTITLLSSVQSVTQPSVVMLSMIQHSGWQLKVFRGRRLLISNHKVWALHSLCFGAQLPLFCFWCELPKTQTVHYIKFFACFIILFL